MFDLFGGNDVQDISGEEFFDGESDELNGVFETDAELMGRRKKRFKLFRKRKKRPVAKKRVSTVSQKPAPKSGRRRSVRRIRTASDVAKIKEMKRKKAILAQQEKIRRARLAKMRAERLKRMKSSSNVRIVKKKSKPKRRIVKTVVRPVLKRRIVKKVAPPIIKKKRPVIKKTTVKKTAQPAATNEKSWIPAAAVAAATFLPFI